MNEYSDVEPVDSNENEIGFLPPPEKFKAPAKASDSATRRGKGSPKADDLKQMYFAPRLARAQAFLQKSISADTLKKKLHQPLSHCKDDQKAVKSTAENGYSIDDLLDSSDTTMSVS